MPEWLLSQQAIPIQQAKPLAKSLSRIDVPVMHPISFAGDPATMVLQGTGFRTREPAATIAPFPMRMFPRIVAAAPMSTLSLILGCRSPSSFPVP